MYLEARGLQNVLHSRVVVRVCVCGWEDVRDC